VAGGAPVGAPAARALEVEAASLAAGSPGTRAVQPGGARKSAARPPWPPWPRGADVGGADANLA
jgi:hypothetical protein